MSQSREPTMMKINKETIAKLKESVDIISVARALGMNIKASSAERYVSRCPNPHHRDSTPSFNLFSNNGGFFCFGCGTHGDAISLIMLVASLSFPKAVQYLANLAGVDISDEIVDDGSFEWEVHNETVTSASPGESALFNIIEIRKTIHKIANEFGDESEEFLSAFSEYEEILAKIDNASTAVMVEIFSGRLASLNASLKESYFEHKPEVCEK